MLENLFDDFEEYYHVYYVSETDELCIADDCPPDRFEELRQQDAECFREFGEHLFSNFKAKTEQRKRKNPPQS